MLAGLNAASSIAQTSSDFTKWKLDIFKRLARVSHYIITLVEVIQQQQTEQTNYT